MYKKVVLAMAVFILMASSNVIIAKSKSELNLTLVPPAEAAPLEEGYGYLLVNLDVGGVSPSIMLSKLKMEKSLYPVAGKKIKRNSQKRKMTFKGKEKGFYIVKLSAGAYQIDEINTPYFDLPFRLNTEERMDWRITVAEGKTNYIGKLEISKLRSEKSINVNLINRVATDKKLLEKDYADLLANFPLRSGAGYKDDFLSALEGGE